MKIAESNVSMQATSSKNTSLKASSQSAGMVSGSNESNGGRGGIILTADALLNLSEAAITASKVISSDSYTDTEKSPDEYAEDIADELKELENEQKRLTGAASKNNIVDISKAIRARMNRFDNMFNESYSMRLLRSMIKMLTGKDIPLSQIKPPQEGAFRTPSFMSAGRSGAAQGNTLAMITVQKRSVEYYEKESVSFSAEANIKTEDGMEINFELGLNMSRELYSKLETSSVNIGVFKDPLVINFDAASAELSDKKIEFDLDSDGESDQISTLMSGSGYLAIDNGDGIVHDGSQLFGTQNGDGFADLAKHDGDGNGWIDENDAIWDKLRIWTHDESGEAKLIGLGEVGVGAIYLGNVESNYSLEGQSGEEQGRLRKTGFFVNEDGSAGTVQHVDLKI